MTTYSEPLTFTFHGQRAALRVVRDRGECWGEIIDNGLRWIVDTIRSHAQEDDEHALRSFARASKCSANVWLARP